MTVWTVQKNEELRLQAIESTETQMNLLHGFIETLDLKNNEVHKTVALTLMSSIYQMETDVQILISAAPKKEESK